MEVTGQPWTLKCPTDLSQKKRVNTKSWRQTMTKPMILNVRVGGALSEFVAANVAILHERMHQIQWIREIFTEPI
jgi:hypothetical protein